MNYEQMLEKAYETVSVNLNTECGRFDVPKAKGYHMGGKTVISNFLSVASYLRRDPIHFMKFLAKELASQGEIQNEKFILSRKLSSKEVNDKIDKYVCAFVLCPQCKKPDTELLIENGKTMIRCMACGDKFEVHRI